MKNWTVVVKFTNKFKDQEELRRKIFKHIPAISKEEAIFMARSLEDVHEQHWPSGTKWTAEQEK